MCQNHTVSTTKMSSMIEEYYSILNDPNLECIDCKTNEDLIIDEDGDTICTDCLFERRCEEKWGCSSAVGERYSGRVEVEGSTPSSSTKRKYK